MHMNRDQRFQRSHDDAGSGSRARWISAGEAIAGSLIVFGYNVWHLLPNSVPLLFAMGLISFQLREGSWTAMGLRRPKSWARTILVAIVAAALQQAVGQFVVDPLTSPFLHYSARANPLESTHELSMLARWLVIIWTYAAVGEEVGYRGYLLNRIADLGGRSRTALVIGLLWSSIMFGFAHWYQGPAGAVSAAASGIVFGAAYLMSGRNLWVAVLAHGFSDSLALLATHLGLAG